MSVDKQAARLLRKVQEYAIAALEKAGGTLKHQKVRLSSLFLGSAPKQNAHPAAWQLVLSDCS